MIIMLRPLTKRLMRDYVNRWIRLISLYSSNSQTLPHIGIIQGVLKNIDAWLPALDIQFKLVWLHQGLCTLHLVIFEFWFNMYSNLKFPIFLPLWKTFLVWEEILFLIIVPQRKHGLSFLAAEILMPSRFQLWH